MGTSQVVGPVVTVVNQNGPFHEQPIVQIFFLRDCPKTIVFQKTLLQEHPCTQKPDLRNRSKQAMRNTPLVTLNTPRLFANAIRRARRLAKRSGSPTEDQAHGCASLNNGSQTDNRSKQKSNCTTFPENITLSCKRPQSEESEPSLKRACLSSKDDELLYYYAAPTDLSQDRFPRNSMLLQNNNGMFNSERPSGPCKFTNATASAMPSDTLSAACWNPPLPPADLLCLLRASLLPSTPSPPKAFPAPTQPRAGLAPPLPPAAHGGGADLLAFVQDGPGRKHLLSLLRGTAPPPATAAQTFSGAGPAWHAACWTAAPRTAPPCPAAFLPATAGRRSAH